MSEFESWDRRTYEELKKTYGEQGARWLNVYNRDNPKGESYAWIQWKGTQPCIDMNCVCGFDGHLDADYGMYAVFCPECGRKFMVGCNIKLIEVTPEEAEAYGNEHFLKMDDWNE